MEGKKHFFAVDLGATSGRTIIGTLADGKIELEELTRFDNNLIETGGHFYWDIYALYFEIIKGLKLAAQREIPICSIGIDTWGVDFVCVGDDGALLRNPISYRDPHTFGMMEDYFEHAVSKEKVYDTTGIQFMNFNSLFQLYTMRKNGDSALKNASKILFVPDALSYMLTGKMVCEYTIASTAQLVNATTRRLEPSLLHELGLSEKHFGRFVYPGETVGTLTPAVQRLTGLGPVPVIAVAGHDTASAVAAVPDTGKDFAYLSSGTWSLMGIEAAAPVLTPAAEALNLTNEGGVEGTIRLLKNICGMWLLERCRPGWGNASYADLIAEAKAAEPFQSLINPDDPTFANPADMEQAIRDYCASHLAQPQPETRGQVVRCIFESLALRYRQVLDSLRAFSPRPLSALHIIGGGSNNHLLNQWTANACGITVVAGPAEATAIGNIMIQAIAADQATNITAMRSVLSHSLDLPVFEPQDTSAWETVYRRFTHLE